jgi:Astacin (Peptidase family M12A)
MEGLMKLLTLLLSVSLFFISCTETTINSKNLTLEKIHETAFSSDEAMVRTFSQEPELSNKTVEDLQNNKIILHTFSDKKRIVIRNVGGYVRISSDLIVGRTSELPQAVSEYEKNIKEINKLVNTQGFGRSANQCTFYFFGCRAYSINPKLWPGRISYVFNAAASKLMNDSYVRDRWMSYIESWNKISPIQLQPRKYKEPYILFRGEYPAGSVVGNYNTVINGNDYSGQPIDVMGCYSEQCFHHELGHALGLKHEHQRCDRDKFLTFSFDTNDSRFFTDYSKFCDSEFKSYGLYSFDSVMHYRLGTSGNPYGIDMRMEAKNQLPAGEYRGSPSQAGNMERLAESDRLTILAMYGLSEPPDTSNLGKVFFQVKRVGEFAWQDWKTNDSSAGNQGGAGIEAIRIYIKSPYPLSSNIDPEEGLYVEYATNSPKLGWSNYTRNGNVSGTLDYNSPLKGLQIVLRGTHEANYWSKA